MTGRHYTFDVADMAGVVIALANAHELGRDFTTQHRAHLDTPGVATVAALTREIAAALDMLRADVPDAFTLAAHDRVREVTA